MYLKPHCTFRLHGSYEALKYGTRSDGLSDLLGGIVESVPTVISNNPIRPIQLRSYLDTTCIVTCVSIRSINGTQSNKSNSEKAINGIVYGVNYKLCSLDKVETVLGDSVQLVRLQDPLVSETFGSKHGYCGDWSAMSSTWDRVSIQERDRLLGQLDIGEFWMSFVSFTQTFTSLECIHLDTDTAKDESSLSDRRKRWHMKMYQGHWKRGVTAGGCRNHDSFHINPQLLISVSDREDVIVALNQHTAVEPKVIGFTMYKLNSGKFVYRQYGYYLTMSMSGEA